jgi:hypothetical protein
VQLSKLLYPSILYVAALFHVWVAASEADDVRDTGRTSVWRDVYDVEVMGCTWLPMAGWPLSDGEAADSGLTAIERRHVGDEQHPCPRQ